MAAHALAAEAEALGPDLVSWRRRLHQIPEPGFGEFQTAHFIAETLTALGWQVRTGPDAMDAAAILSRDEARITLAYEDALAGGVPTPTLERMRRFGTAVVADLGGGSGPTVAFRVDIDGLPIHEAVGEAHVPAAAGFRSRRNGEMHACGHDGHTAIGLGVATLLARHRNRLPGTVRLIFQPAEEGALGGGAAIAARGLVDDVDALLSGHLGLGVPSGTLVTRGLIMGTTKIRLSFRGQPAHPVLAPQDGRNALLAGAAAALSLHTIAPHPGGWFNLNVGVLRAGESQGVSPELAVLELGIWATSADVHQYVNQRVREIAEGAASSWQVTLEQEPIGDASLTVQDAELGQLAAQVASEVPGISEVVDSLPIAAADDATLLIEHVRQRGGRGIYSVFGSDLADGHHTSDFDFDERSLSRAVGLIASLLERLLREGHA